MTAIEFENVSKQYRLGLVGTQTLAHDLRRFWITNIRGKEDPYLKIGETNDRATKGNSDYVWALRDINFKVEQGDVLGIIGKNGAGKSTLLKLLSRVTGPTTGAIRARGRIGSLLEVGTGFHPEMTGRENIYMNGAILGMTRREIDRKLDEIIDFSGCERYIDTPVKRYSSGMTVRLGFAVAAHLEPEILVVDEVLAVGDIEFQKKAIGKMKDVSRGEGRTVLFVSHNMDSIRNLCETGLVLKNGAMAFSGSATEAVDFYLQNASVDFVQHIVVDGVMARHNKPNIIDRRLEFSELTILNDPEHIATDEPLQFKIKIKRNQSNTTDFQCALIFFDNFGKRFSTAVSPMMKFPDNSECCMVNLNYPNHHLAKGRYSIQFDLGIKDYSNKINNFDGIEDAFLIEVDRMKQNPAQYYGPTWDQSYGNILDNTSVEATVSTIL